MSTGAIVGISAAALTAVLGLTYMVTYNGFQRKDEGVTAAERTIASCYQKRADLITNQEAAVERIMKQENQVIIGNANARNTTQKLPDNATPEQVTAFIQAQGNTLARLNALTESVPNIATAANMALFQRDLKGVESQCSILRNRYIDSVKGYNAAIRTFPSNIVAGNHGYTVKKQIEFENEQQNRQSPRVFGK